MDQYERLKGELPDIAKAVNEFKSEQVQQQAFRALVQALGMPAVVAEPDDDLEDDEAVDAAPVIRTRTRRRKATNDNGAAAGARSKKRVQAPSSDDTLNLRPAGKQSFAEFAEEKKPQNFDERNLVAAYYLKNVIGSAKITVDQIYTCYIDRKWRVPTNLRNSLSKTAVKGWLDSSAMDDLKVTVPGQNHVVHDLPAKTAK